MPHSTFVIRNSTFTIPPSPPLVMGILNVTPDSFSDGGDHFSHQDALAHGLDMISQGANIIDVGGESTRPGSAPISPEEQLRRTIPVIHALRAHNSDIIISIDTRSATVARQAIEAGADIVNDVAALRDDPDIAGVIAASSAAVVLMHRRGTSADMQDRGGPAYYDVIAEISAFLLERRDFAIRCGIDRSRIIFDPGLGFGKRVEHNLTILRCLDQLVALGQPLLLGASRKRFIGSVLGEEDPRRRLAGSLACAVQAALQGASILRVHDVRLTAEAMRLLSPFRNSEKALQ